MILWVNFMNNFSSYAFIKALSNILEEDAVVVTANGEASISCFRDFEVKKGQRLIANSGCASMGYGLPASIGACVANDRKTVICLEGDGSIQMNIQELQTVVHENLPIKIFVFNNGGYKSIQNTQDKYFDGYRVGADEKSGVSFPNITRVARAYDIETSVIGDTKDLHKKLREIINTPRPHLCELVL